MLKSPDLYADHCLQTLPALSIFSLFLEESPKRTTPYSIKIASRSSVNCICSHMCKEFSSRLSCSRFARCQTKTDLRFPFCLRTCVPDKRMDCISHRFHTADIMSRQADTHTATGRQRTGTGDQIQVYEGQSCGFKQFVTNGYSLLKTGDLTQRLFGKPLASRSRISRQLSNTFFIGGIYFVNETYEEHKETAYKPR